MEQNGAAFKPVQMKAVAFLASGRSQTETAEELGIGRNTLLRWLQEPEFKNAIAEAVSAQFDDAVARSTALATKALQSLEDIMADHEASGHVRVKASEVVLNFAHNAMKLANAIALEKKAASQANETQVVFNFGAPIVDENHE